MNLTVRPMTAEEFPMMTDYFLSLGESTLRGMGVEPSRLPEANAWHQLLVEDLAKSLDQRQFWYVIWALGGVPIGHSNINKIEYGDKAFLHLHIWDANHRRSGYGTEFLCQSIRHYFDYFRLQKLYCEPLAANDAPNRILPKSGFQLVQTYETTPGWINFQQTVNRWELPHSAIAVRKKHWIETERLVLREFELDDAQDVYAFASNPQVTRYTCDSDVVNSVDDVRRIIVDVWHSDYRNHGYGRLAVVHKKDDKVIGFCGLKYLDDMDEIDIGYRFLPEYWGQGIATEAASACLRHAETNLGLRNIIGLVMAENTASHRVLQKLGFRHTKETSTPESEHVAVYRR